MSSINLHSDEIGIKVVYYGPGLGGKTSSLQYMHAVLKPENRGRLISLATGIDRTLYFDFLPIQLPKIKNFSIRMSMYTVPGQVHYDATRKLVLQGADGVVFVADSQESRHDANIESMENLHENLRAHGMNPRTVPLVIQYNKRDVQSVLPVEQMNRDLNPRGVPWFETSAISGQGIFEALKAITKLVLADLKRKGIYQENAPSAAVKVPSVAPPRGDDETSVRISMADESNFDDISRETSGSGSIEFDTVPPSEVTNRSSSTSLEAAIAEHAANAVSSGMPSGVPSLNPPLPVAFSSLWKSGPTCYKVIEMESLIGSGRYREATEGTLDILKEHLVSSGASFVSIEESLLSLGVSGAHYIRFKSVIDKTASGDSSRQGALFCLFFLTDVELRLQSAGIRA